MLPESAERRAVIAVIGPAAEPPPTALAALAEAIGRGIVDRGHRLVTGGLLGVMQAASRGAAASERCGDGDILGVLPGYDRHTANPFVQIAIPTGAQLARNVLVVAMADVVVAIGGGAGTLSEIALAWQLGKPIVALTGVEGWSDSMADLCLDDRQTVPIRSAGGVNAALAALDEALSGARPEPRNIGAGRGRK